MPVHHGRHEMPGWRGYLPESVDRRERGRTHRPGATVAGPTSHRLAAVGAIAACVVAGGALIQARSTEPPDPSPGPGDDAASVPARNAAWTREATPALASLEVELRRTDDVRQRWDSSPLARRGGPPPGAVVALLDRRTELVHHRDALRTAMDTIRSEPASEAGPTSAWPQLRAAQAMLRALASGRGRLGDPVEEAVLRLVLGEDPAVTSGDEPASGRDARTAATSGAGDARTIALAAATVELAESPAAAVPAAAVPAAAVPAGATPTVVVAPARVAPALFPAVSTSDDVAEPVPTDSAEADGGTARPESTTPAIVPTTDGGGTGDRVTTTEGGQEPESPTASSMDAPSGSTILTFERPSPATPDPTSVGEEDASPTTDVTNDVTTDAGSGEDAPNSSSRNLE